MSVSAALSSALRPPTGSDPAASRPDIVVDALGVPAWVRRWAAGSGRSARALPAGALGAAAATGGTLVLPRIGPGPSAHPRVVAVVGDGVDDLPVVTEAADVATLLDGSLQVVHGVPLSFGERSVGLDEAVRHGRSLLAQVRAQLAAAGFAEPVSTELVRAWPHEIVGELLLGDLLAIGGPHRSGTRLGPVAASAVHHTPCAVVLVPRHQPGGCPPGPWQRRSDAHP